MSSSVTLCIVAKRCVLEQKLLLTAYKKSVIYKKLIGTKINDLGGYCGAAPPPFRPGNPALCGSRPLVTPYYCRLKDLQSFAVQLKIDPVGPLF